MPTLRLLFSLAISVCLLLSQTKKPDFSGTWKADQSKSTTTTTPAKNPNQAAADDAPPPPPLDEQPPEVIQQKGTTFGSAT